MRTRPPGSYFLDLDGMDDQRKPCLWVRTDWGRSDQEHGDYSRQNGMNRRWRNASDADAVPPLSNFEPVIITVRPKQNRA